MNLSRELNIKEIQELTGFAHTKEILTEVFVHGAYCIGFSGLCYLSSVQTGNSGNRGRCSQTCRDPFSITKAGYTYPLNMKDNSAFFDVTALAKVGVDSLKIEGRIKQADYVFTIVNRWKKHLQKFYQTGVPTKEDRDLYTVFNRDFSNGYLQKNIGSSMFIDNPRNQSIQLLSQRSEAQNAAQPMQIQSLYDENKERRNRIQTLVSNLLLKKRPISIEGSGKAGEHLSLRVQAGEISFSFTSKSCLRKGEQSTLSLKTFKKRFKGLNTPLTTLQNISLQYLQDGLFIPFQELSDLKKNILEKLKVPAPSIPPVQVPFPLKPQSQITTPKLAVLISSEEDLSLLNTESVEVYFQIPSGLAQLYHRYVQIFQNHPKVIPWFPSILIGEDFEAADQFLRETSPKKIVTDNTGVANQAIKMGIEWIAGPDLNITNSFSLLCLQESLDCKGAYISNELSRKQIEAISAPPEFDLYYRIFHPTLLLTSRQCLFQQTSGCHKGKVDQTCLSSCQKSTILQSTQGKNLFIHKQKGEYTTLYNETHTLNTDVLSDLPGKFVTVLIDLRNIKTNTKFNTDKVETIQLFQNLIHKVPISANTLHQSIAPTHCSQYEKGLL